MADGGAFTAMSRRALLGAAGGAAVWGGRAGAAADPAPPSAAIERMQALGPEDRLLARRAGEWDVVASFWPSPDAAPAVTRGLTAKRSMVGLYLEEAMQPGPGSKVPDFRRIAYLTYSKVEGRWQYVSLDTRLPVGIMPAASFDKGSDRELTLEFQPLAFVGFGPQVEGRMTRSNLVLTREDADHDLARQYWVAADGTGRKWLAVQYEYARRL